VQIQWGWSGHRSSNRWWFGVGVELLY